MNAYPSPTPTPPSWGQRVARFLARLVRLILWTLFLLALLGGLAALIGWGIPYVDRHILQPLQDAQARIAQLEAAQADWEQRWRQAEEERADLQAQLAVLQAQQRDLAEGLAALSTQVADLTAQQDETRTTLDQVEAQLAALRELSERLDSLELQAREQAAYTADLRRAALVQRLLLHIAQARQALQQEDWRLAQEEILRARSALDALEPWTTEPAERSVINEARTRLDLAYNKALTAPDIAARDLDVVWALINQAFLPLGAQKPQPPQTSETPAEPTGTPTPSPTPTPTPTPTATP